ncbi:hypothetical protein PGB28_12115 [Primorskyibacter aestuariivivens]|uniref:hypothetical protein n=1 Tax=Primorskyibacter aestuariivivens TaxID=1888912 RepID=UPI002301DF88|nr:hypothetical protein [Primorskyibacter aestuariivivens]MDA7429207.1 hypothetical protein [Primorskyibacter aestuariivivens]
MSFKCFLSGAIFAGLASSAAAHEFTAGLLVTGSDAVPRLTEVVNGFLLAADERDGHANETSDGHLGGVDVQILPLPHGSGAGLTGLSGNPSQRPDVVVIFGDEPVQHAMLPPGVPIVRPGTLPPDTVWQQGNFADRYRAAYGRAPTRDAASGYNEARRLDHAIRPLDGLSPTDAFQTSIKATSGGTEW